MYLRSFLLVLEHIDLEQKLPLYLEKGVHEVWIIDPEDQSISRYAKENVVEQAKGEQFV